ncbi:MAG TPA: hypothetical protein VFM53_15575 [Anaeromyxobacteraceae bacterium]|nr:hypothetical protein [Anaeromyxobacteraceae bacterium]
MRKPILLVSLLLSTSVLAGCQTTALQSAWFDPSFTGGPMHRIAVVAVGVSPANQRLAEDVFTQRLQARGVHAAPGWAVVPAAARDAPEPFTEALRASGAEGVLIMRLLGVDTRTQVNTMMVTTTVPMWGPGWGGASVWATTTVPVSQVSMYNLVMVETSLYEVATGRRIWSGITQTLNPADFARDVGGFADVIIGQLAARRLLGSAR